MACWHHTPLHACTAVFPVFSESAVSPVASVVALWVTVLAGGLLVHQRSGQPGVFAVARRRHCDRR